MFRNAPPPSLTRVPSDSKLKRDAELFRTVPGGPSPSQLRRVPSGSSMDSPQTARITRSPSNTYLSTRLWPEKAAKDDTTLSESAKLMEHLKQQRELHYGKSDMPKLVTAQPTSAEYGGGAPKDDDASSLAHSPSKTKTDLLKAEHINPMRAGLNSTGLLNECHTVFTLADWDTNGTLDMDELAELRGCLKRLHPDLYPHPLTPELADKIVGTALDTDGDGVISRTEWIEFIVQQAHTYGERPMLKLMKVLGKQLAQMWKQY